MDLQQLEINVNLHALQPNFINYELHYIIASNENTFRFANWNDKPGDEEQKFYCFLTEQPLHIPAGDINLTDSYVLKEQPIYPSVCTPKDFIPVIEQVKNDGSAKCIREFDLEEVDNIVASLKETYGSIEKHVVTSSQGQHMLLVFENIEISVSTTMVYFRNKTPFSQSHYETVKEEGKEEVNQ